MRQVERVDHPLIQLLGDFRLPEYFRDTQIRWIDIWMDNNPAVNRSQLHNDNHDNLYVMVHGRKSFTLFPPHDAEHLYTQGRVRQILANGRIIYDKPADGGLPQFSRLDLANVDLEQFPLFAKTTPLEVELNPNEMQFLPSGWFHEVHSYGKNIAMNFWANPPGV